MPMVLVLRMLMLVRHPLVRNVHMHLRHRHMLWEQALTIRAHRESVSMSVSVVVSAWALKSRIIRVFLPIAIPSPERI